MEQIMPIGNIGFVESIEMMYPTSVLKTLLFDRTTGKNIIWADDEYEAIGEQYLGHNEITIPKISGTNSGVIKPRIAKALEKQSQRTKTHAEVFTPAWLVNQMNGYMDDDWFGREGVFSTCEDRSWQVTADSISFDGAPGTWKDFIDQRRLEITCGEAPFITTRYDMLTGDAIDVKDRIGFLDRKLRVVTENATDYDEWLKWAYRALEATYGYEYQGDNLLIARINVLQAFAEAMQHEWDKLPSEKEALRAAKIISWNIWQMDGLKGTVPSDKPVGDAQQMSMFDFLEEEKDKQAQFCMIYDWRAKKSQAYVSMKH
ncbi:hypothetical protein [Adlercreutzia sp. ZJ141]|uniref:hypothetical protein n=1 Tax=Adlercreutzia sp. ZJ141 TaxID=2709406 RepID=UPI00197E118F|nr:hypothetical protein [Adlercreutzia sp. ZJ141]